MFVQIKITFYLYRLLQTKTYKMENPPLIITLSADDIQPSEFVSFIEANYPSSISTSVEIQEKKGRNAVEHFTKLLFSDDMAVNLLASAIFKLLEFGFTKLQPFFDAKPKAVVKLKNGKKIELPASMSEAEITAELADCLQKGVASIRLDS